MIRIRFEILRIQLSVQGNSKIDVFGLQGGQKKKFRGDLRGETFGLKRKFISDDGVFVAPCFKLKKQHTKFKVK